MQRSRRCLPAVLLACLATTGFAQDQAVDTSQPPAADGTPSLRASAMLAALRPKFDPAAVPPRPPAPSPLLRSTGTEEPAADVVQLPRFVVRDRTIPPPDVADRRAFERRVVAQYLGPRYGIDRGFLNVVTIAQLWKKIPLLGETPAPFNSVTNEERATGYYQEEEMRDLAGLLSMKPAPSPAKKPKEKGKPNSAPSSPGP